MLKKSAFIFILSTNALSATISVVGSDIIVSGVIKNEDHSRFLEIVDGNKNLNRVIFDNCLGGWVSAGYRFAETIRKNKLNTIAQNQCHSSCAYAFLAGIKHSFSDKLGDHNIFLHSGRNTDSEINAAEKINPILMKYLLFLTDGRLTGHVNNLITNSTLANQGVAFTYSRQLLSSTYKTRYCNGTENRIDLCAQLHDADPFDLGILTSK